MCWQTNERRAWTYLVMYWFLGAWVGIQMGYLPTSSPPLLEQKSDQDLLWWYYLMAFAITLCVQPVLLIRFGSFGRRFNWPTVATFALLNGTFETVFFLATYDAGKRLASDGLGLSRTRSTLIALFGFGTLNLYSAAIHKFFWLARVFPRHIQPNAPPFLSHMLPALIIMSMAWIILYEQTGDVSTFCVLHSLTDVFATAKICLSPPFKLLPSLSATEA